MKKWVFFIMAFSLLASSSIMSQTILAAWTFPSGTPTDSLADISVPQNSGKSIKAIGSSAIDYTKNGYTTKSAQTINWDNGNGTKYWKIEVSSMGYHNLHLSSRQQSGGNNPGPRDFKIQYSTDLGSHWIDVPNGSILTANDFTTAFVDSISLPTACDNTPSLTLRWLMNSDTSSTGTMVAAAGVSKIDDIYVYGETLISINENTAESCKIFPNPAKDYIHISSPKHYDKIIIINYLGKLCWESTALENINISSFENGVYFMQLYRKGTLVSVRKFVKAD